MKAFKTPAYDCLFRRKFEFEKFGRMDIYWIELDYWIDRDSFESRIGRPLDVNMVSYGGIPIFKDARDKSFIASKNMVLIKETPSVQLGFQDVYKVTELYGYAPDETFIQHSAEVVSFPGLSDESGYLKQNFPTGTGVCSYDAAVEEFTINIGQEAVLNFGVGEKVRLFGEKISSSQLDMIFPEVEVLKVFPSRGEIVIPAVGFFFDDTEDAARVEKSARISSFWLNGRYYHGGVLQKRTAYLIRKIRERAPEVRQCLVKRKITYHSVFPEIEEKLTPRNSIGAQLEYIDSQTSPNIDDWNSGIANGDYFNVADSEIDDTFAPIIYKRTTKTTKYR